MKLPNPTTSVFVKILFPLFFAMILISVVIATAVMPFFRPPGPPKGPPGGGFHHRGAPPPVVDYFKRVEKALNNETTLESAASAMDPHSDIIFESGTKSFKSSPDLGSWAELKARSQNVEDDEGSIIGMLNGRPFFGRETPIGKIILIGHWGPPNLIRSGSFWFVLSLQVGGVLILTYLLLAWQLRPLKKLSFAITELTRGNLAYRIHLKDSGEFGLLGNGFNEMANRISEMLRGKEELLLGVSHELRSPLASIRVLIEMIGDERKKEQIKFHLMRMESLVSELLDSQRLSSTHGQPRLEMTSIAEILIQTRERFVDSAPGLELAFEHQRLEAPVDPRLIDRLFSNLIENALKYSKHQNQPVRVTARESDTEVQIDVTDAGPGIPAADLPNIFEPFYRVDKSRNRDTGGFGLGLFLCAKIVERHAGKIDVENIAPQGCRFRVTLPKRVLSKSLS